MVRKKVNKKFKIAVAMSGGVDSSVAAKLLKDQGHEVIGIFLYFWKEECQPGERQGGRLGLSADSASVATSEKVAASTKVENKCCSSQALEDARRVAEKIGIPLQTYNFADIFKRQVVDNFLAEYATGRTPNPCVRCNKLVKLGWLIKQVKRLGFDCLASGHYARRVKSRLSSVVLAKGGMSKVESQYKLLRAKDKNKDQSYFLYTFSQKELSHLLFPLGNYTKPEIRHLAKKFKLPVAEKTDSQEICFIPEKSHNEFLGRHLELKPGQIKLITIPLDKGGVRGIKSSNKNTIPPTPFIKGEASIIGRHQGLPLYTIGQRKGIKISGGPFYVARMDYKTNTLYVINDSKDPLIYRDSLTVKRINWLSGIEPKMPLACRAVIRYHHKPAECMITKFKNNFVVKFKKQQRAITPGQSVVFYRGDEMLGGGIIR